MKSHVGNIIRQCWLETIPSVLWYFKTTGVGRTTRNKSQRTFPFHEHTCMSGTGGPFTHHLPTTQGDKDSPRKRDVYVLSRR